jgi:hypothetical protein
MWQLLPSVVAVCPSRIELVMMNAGPPNHTDLFVCVKLEPWVLDTLLQNLHLWIGSVRDFTL